MLTCKEVETELKEIAEEIRSTFVKKEMDGIIKAIYKTNSPTKEEIKDEISRLIKLELKRTYAIGRGGFNSTHQGYAVLKEEIEETAEEADKLIEQLEKLWDYTRRDMNGRCLNMADEIYKTALAAAYEAIQAAAMAKKYNISLKGE